MNNKIFKSPGVYVIEPADIFLHEDYHIYCPNCYSELFKTYAIRQYCHKCKTDVLYITNNEIREHKLDKLLNR